DLFALHDEAIERATTTDARRELLEDAALAAKELVSDPARAMRYYQALHAIQPDPRVRVALERLYERHDQHRALIELLSSELSSGDEEAKQRLRARIARLWFERAREPEPALAIVEEMLAVEPERVEAFELLEQLLQSTAGAPGGAKARQRAASRLEARYRA